MAGKKVSQLTSYAVLRESDEIVINDNSTPPITKKTSLKELSDFVLAGLPPGSNEVTQITAGSNVTVNPTTGKGNVTINAIDTGLTDVVQDLTPQLGGDLELNGFDIKGNGNIRSSGFTSSDNYFSFGTGTNIDFTINFPIPSGRAFEIYHSFSDPGNGLEFKGPYFFGSEMRRDIFLGTSGTPSEFKDLNPVNASEFSFGATDKRWSSIHTDKAYIHSTLQLQSYYDSVGTPVGSKLEFDETGNNCIYSDSNSGPSTASLNIKGYSTAVSSKWQLALYADNDNDSSSAWIQLNRTPNRIEFYTNGVERSYIENDRMHLHHLLQLMSIADVPTDGRSGDMCNVGGELYFHNGSDWMKIYLYGQDADPTPPGDVDWDNVILRMTYDEDFNYITSYSELPAAKTPVGTPSIDDNNPKYGSAGAIFNSGNGYNYNFNSSIPIVYNFTIEFWWQMTAGVGFDGKMFEMFMDNSSDNLVVGIDSDKTMYVERNEVSIMTSPSQLVDNSYNHIALTRDSDGLRLYLNGDAQNGTTVYSNSLDISQLMVGSGAIGWMDDFRLTKDCRYTGGSFTPPQQALPISN